MKTPADAWTGFLRGALRFLMLHSPMRTSLGATGGVCVGVLLDMFSPLVRGVDLSKVTDFRLAIAGIFVSNVTGIFKKEKFPETIEEQFAVAAKAIKDGELTQAQAKMLYIQIVTNALQHAKLTTEAQREVDEFNEQVRTARARQPRPPSAA